MKILLLICALWLVQQDRWTISLNGQAIASGTDQPLMVVWKGNKKDKLSIDYQKAASNIRWKRNFVVTTTKDSVLGTYSFNYASGKFELPGSAITSALMKMDTIKLHTEEHPADEQMMLRSKIQPLLVITKK